MPGPKRQSSIVQFPGFHFFNYSIASVDFIPWCLARIALNVLEYLYHNDFRTWVTDVLHLSQTCGVENCDMDCNSF